MKTSHRFILILVLLLGTSAAYTQTAQEASTLSFSEFMNLVKSHHPVIKQANLIERNANATKLLATGNFDPKFFYEFNSKQFDAKNYYQFSNGGIKIPTWFGIEVKSGFEQNQGYYLNPESTTPNKGLAYAQISLPLLQGLLIDERRATLQQAKLVQGLSYFDKINACNELLYKSGKAYFDWQLAFVNQQVYKNAVNLSAARLDAIRKTVMLGDRPAIDTLEALIQLQDRAALYEQAQLDYKTKSYQLSNFLWSENNTPVDLNPNLIPETSEVKKDREVKFQAYAQIMDSLLLVHPALKPYEYKLKQLNFEKKLKQDKLKPSLNVNYNPLFADGNFSYQNNYKWGIGVGFPLFLKKERAELQLTKIKIDQTYYESIYKSNELSTKIKTSSQEFASFKIQLKLFQNAVSNYESLWNSEKRMFDSGESSLFLINSREMSFINAQLKLNELNTKNNKAAFDIEYLYGMLSSVY